MKSKTLLLTALGTAAALCLASCTAAAPDPGLHTQPYTAPTPADPLNDLKDPQSVHYNLQANNVVLHERMTGPHTFTVAPPAGVPRVEYFVVCAPASTFKVTTSGWYSGPCDGAIQNAGGLLISAKERAEKRIDVQVDVPAGVSYWIVGLPMEDKQISP